MKTNGQTKENNSDEVEKGGFKNDINLLNPEKDVSGTDIIRY